MKNPLITIGEYIAGGINAVLQACAKPAYWVLGWTLVCWRWLIGERK